MAKYHCAVCNRPMTFQGMCFDCAEEWRSIRRYRLEKAEKAAKKERDKKRKK